MDVRALYLDFFKNKGHELISSMPLVPDDASLLFTNAGMVQFKDIFTGNIPRPKNPRASSCQLCIRAGGKHNDLENVGYTARHHTLFEMLGNFSFGDYFKKDAICYAWEFITQILELPIDKLWVTIHTSDDEAFEIWKQYISEDRIKRFGDKDNFWAMGDSGPCGPCSEIFYDQGSEFFSTEEDYLGGEGDRFLEIWNLVFMQYKKEKDGTVTPLPKPSIDTGMGLERVIAIKEGVYNNFDSSLFTPLIQKIEELSGLKTDKKNIGSFRVIADHIRAVSFLLAQGVLFSNEGRGYVNRRILRRCVRHGYLLGIKNAFMSKLVDTLCDIFAGHYCELEENKTYIKEQIKLEEERFFTTLEKGMGLFNEELKNTKDGAFSAKIAFKLYDTYGFPLDLTQDMLKDKNISIDTKAFDKFMDEQRAKSSWKGSGDKDENGDFKVLIDRFGLNNFVGYKHIEYSSEILGFLDENFKEQDEAKQGEISWVLLNDTPFYATSGGQNGDFGELEKADKKVADVLKTQKFHGLNLSQIKPTQNLKANERVLAKVFKRAEVQKHHSATHLLQAALRKVLGTSVTQAGSFNDFNKLRFDFTFARALSYEEIRKTEALVNEEIAKAVNEKTEELPLEEAKKKGALAMFGEKYGKVVRVVSFADFSVEFCGGTHVKNTSEIGSFYISKESGASAGVRRIEAFCGLSAISYAQSFIKTNFEAKTMLKNNDILLAISKLQEQNKTLKKDLELSQNKSQEKLNIQTLNDTSVIVEEVKQGDIKKIIDEYKNKLPSLGIFLFQVQKDKIMMVAGSKKSKIKANLWIKEVSPLLNGGGGGREDFAQAGGKNKEPKDLEKNLEFAKQKALEYAKQILG